MTHLIQELRRRNIFRVAGVYAVVGWLVIQLGIALETSLNLPPWFDTVLTTLVLIGFPMAMILAWALELTPDGVKRTEAVTEGESIRLQTGRKVDIAIVAGLVLVVVVIVGNRLMPKASPPVTTVEAPAAQTGTSIAVLPFADMSQAKDQEYFSDGMAEEILNALTKVGDLRVAGRTSSFSFKGKDDTIQDIGTALKVEHVLEGSVRKQGENVRIAAQLIRSSDGFHLWSETYDGTLDNVFQLQDTVAQAITRELQIKLDIGQEALAGNLTNNKEAYDLYLQALEKRGQLWGDDVLPSAVRMLERAVELDPNFTQAWGLLARVNQLLPVFNTVLDGTAYLDAAEVAAKRALALDPKNQEAELTLALVQGQRGNLAAAFEYFYSAENKEPQTIGAAAIYTLAVGQNLSAIPRLERAIENDPYAGNYLLNLATAKFRTGDVASAEKYSQRCIDIDFTAIYLFLAEVHAFKGDRQAAVQAFMTAYDTSRYRFDEGTESRIYIQQFADAVYGQDNEARIRVTARMQQALGDPQTMATELLLFVLVQMGEPEMFFDLYNRNQIAAANNIFTRLWDPYMPGAKAVRQHKDFPAFIERVGIFEIWQKHGWADLCRPNPGTDGSNGNFTCD